MIEMEMENQRVERLRSQRPGKDWIQVIAEKQLGRLEQFCQPGIVSRLLLPKRFVNLDSAAALVAEYHDWFGDCTDIQLEASRVGWVGERLGIFYRFRLLPRRRRLIEQQLYCTLKDGRVERLNSVCSGFQLEGFGNQAEPAVASKADEQLPTRDSLLEFHIGGSSIGSTCAVLTPAIRSKLREMQSGQVLEVRVDDPDAKNDVEAWSRLSGNTLLKVIDDEGPELRFFVKKNNRLEKGDYDMAKLMINCTHGQEDPERATLAFVVGNVAASADQEAVVLLTIEGVWNATRSYADDICKEGFQPLKEVMQSFVSNGGQIWVCGACAKPRGITGKDLVDGARIVTAANAVEYLASGAGSLAF